MKHLFHDIPTTIAETTVHIYCIVRSTAITLTEQTIVLTAAMEGFDSSPGLGCVTPAPKNITGSWNILVGLDENHTP